MGKKDGGKKRDYQDNRKAALNNKNGRNLTERPKKSMGAARKDTGRVTRSWASKAQSRRF
jgi:hypothetical protein